MSEVGAEPLGSFRTKLDLATELALAELPSHLRYGFLSSQQSRHQFMKWAMTEGICALAKLFEEGRELDRLNWRFEVVQGPGVTSQYTEFYQRAKALDAALGESSSSAPS